MELFVAILHIVSRWSHAPRDVLHLDKLGSGLYRKFRFVFATLARVCNIIWSMRRKQILE